MKTARISFICIAVMMVAIYFFNAGITRAMCGVEPVITGISFTYPDQVRVFTSAPFTPQEQKINTEYFLRERHS